MKFTHDFKQDLTTLLHEAEHGEPFAFVRFNDGERAILQDRQVPTADGWKVGNPTMRRMLGWSLKSKLPRLFKGITCPCCDYEGADYYRKELADNDPATLTYANLFVNGNADRALEFFARAAKNWCVVSCAWGSDIRVPADWSVYDENKLEWLIRGTALRISNQKQPVLVAAGPMGKPIIDIAWAAMNPTGYHGGFSNTIIDIGSVLDPLLFHRASRGYHDPNHPNRQKVCSWE